MKKIFDFLLENSPRSSMRLGFIAVILGGCWVMFRLGVYINAFAKRGVEITQWDGMALFFLSVGAAMTGIAWAKMKQKVIEKSNTQNDENAEKTTD